VKPDSLIKRRGTGAVKGGDNKTDGTGMDTKQMKDDSESVSLQKRTEEESKQLDQKNETKVKSGMESGTGMQTSQSMLSSMLEGSEDEESRRQDAKRKKREEKRGLSDAEKNAQIDITL
jgi:hypothetical protein